MNKVNVARRVRMAGAVGALALGLGLSGCVGYSNYPAVPGAYGGKNVNVGDVIDNGAFAVKWAMQHYPPGQVTAPMTETYAALTKAQRQELEGQVAVSFLPGMRRESCLRLIEIIGPGAVPLTPETEHLPIYRISTVDVMGDSGRVTVHRPVGTLASGEPVYQGISIKMRGGLRRWAVVSHRVWDVATVTLPPPVYLPEAGAIGEGTMLAPPRDPSAPPPADPLEIPDDPPMVDPNRGN